MKKIKQPVGYKSGGIPVYYLEAIEIKDFLRLLLDMTKVTQAPVRIQHHYALEKLGTEVVFDSVGGKDGKIWKAFGLFVDDKNMDIFNKRK